MFRLGLAVVFFILGFIVSVYSLVVWVDSGMPLNDLLPTKNGFGSNIIHYSFLGAVGLVYGLCEWLIHKK